MTEFTPTLASPDTLPPTSSSYWVVPQLLLAGAYPGHPDPDEHHVKVQSLVGAGIRTIVNLMEPDETNYAGDSFVPYQDLARQLCPEIACIRHPIRDVLVPTIPQMVSILDAIDGQVKIGKPVYVHCWGGVGRTGTVVGCWLLRHGLTGGQKGCRGCGRTRAPGPQSADRGTSFTQPAYVWNVMRRQTGCRYFLKTQQ